MTLHVVVATPQAWQVYCERQPLKFLDRELLPLLVFITRQLAKFIGKTRGEISLA